MSAVRDGAARARSSPRRSRRLRRFLAAVGLALLALLAVDLARPPSRQLTARALIGAARTYQRAAPESGPLRGKCRFTPTCSGYAVTVIRRFGALRGGWLAARRLLRCGPWTARGTVDPPPAPSGE